MSVVAGTQLANRYLLLDRIGGGGMGAVWQASDTVLDRPVAVKVLAAQLSDDPEFRQRFRREARAAARLDHPAITQVYDYGELEQTTGVVQFLVMELLPGRTLAERLEQGPLPVPEVAAIGARVADALASAHRNGVVHRDVTPGNIMLTPGGVKVLDFGISMVAGDASMTVVGQTLGTPAYLAPERVQGLPATPAVDVYALGAVLYYAATGRTPYQGTWTEQAHAHLHQPAPDPEQIPGPLGRVLHACLSKWPDDRPTAAQLADALRGLTAVAPPPPVPVARPAVPVYQASSTQVLPAAQPASYRAAPPRRSRPGMVALVALALFLAGAIAMFALNGLFDDTGNEGTSPPTDPATTASTAGTPSESPSDSIESLTAEQALDRITALVSTATVNGQITPRVAIDIGRSLGRVVERVAEQEYRQADDQLEDLQRRIEDRFEAGDINASVYFELSQTLERLRELVPNDNPDNDHD